MYTHSISRRALLRLATTGTLAGMLRPAQCKTPMNGSSVTSSPAELLIISQQGTNHPLVRSLVCQLLERGVHFEHSERQTLPAELPGDFEGYRVIAFDAPAYQAAMQQPTIARKLEQYVATKGLVFQLTAPGDAGNIGNLAYDVAMAEEAGILIAHGGLKERHPALRARQLAREDGTILAELRSENLQRVERLRDWGEFNNHYWRPAMVLAEHGDTQALEKLQKAVRECSEKMPAGILGQSLAGMWAPAWLFRQTGERGPLDKAVAVFDHVLSQRPRTYGVLNWNGFMDDPLGRQNAAPDKGMGWEQPTVSMRTVNWNEALHMQCGPLASLTRATGNARYLDEALKLISHCAKYHLDARDHLLHHATRDGRPASGKWGRGMTHALYGMIFTAEEMDAKDPRRQEVLDVIAQIGEGLSEVQDAETGLWRNEVSQPMARIESSCTTGIVYVFARCITEGWLPRESFQRMVVRGWEGLKQMYWSKGFAAQCRGSSIGTAQYYASRPQGWGAVPQALMAAQMVKKLAAL